MQTNPLGTIRFRDKIALVTGGASGIGRATANRLASEGAHVIIADKNADMARQAVSEIQETGGKANYIAVDIADDESVRTAAHAVAEKFSALHLFVNNAAILRTGKIEEMVDAGECPLVDKLKNAQQNAHDSRCPHTTGICTISYPIHPQDP